jgi:hypothetical protein
LTYGAVAIAAGYSCGSRSELELDEPEEHDGGADVRADVRPPLDSGSDRRESGPDAGRDAVVDRPSFPDVDARDARLDVALDVRRDAPFDARDAPVVDARRDSSFEAGDAAGIEAGRDSPAEARDAADAADASDADADASEGAACEALGPAPRRFKIGVVESPTGALSMLPDGGLLEAIQDCVNRMTSVFGAYSDVERIPLASIDARIPQYDLVVLCSDWAEYDSASILPHATAFTSYVTGGGGLLMYQPNKTMRVDLLPAWYAVQFVYNDTSVSIVAEHPVTCGIDVTEVPYPADRITDFSPEWVELVRGDQSGDASLLVTELGAGRAAVDANHDSKMALRPESDRFLERLGRWLMKSLP